MEGRGAGGRGVCCSAPSACRVAGGSWPFIALLQAPGFPLKHVTAVVGEVEMHEHR